VNAPPIAREAKAREANEHHRPGRRLGDLSDDEREILVCPLPPRPFIGATRRPEAGESLAAIGRGSEESGAGGIAFWHADKITAADYGDQVSAATTGVDAQAPTPETRWSREPVVCVGWRVSCGPGGYVGFRWGHARFGCPAESKGQAGQVDRAAPCGD